MARMAVPKLGDICYNRVFFSQKKKRDDCTDDIASEGMVSRTVDVSKIKRF